MASEALLNSWKEIARYVGRSERTVQRWEKQFGFPVRRPAGRARSAVIAIPSEIRCWSTSTTVSGGNGDSLPAEAGRQNETVVSTNSSPTLLCIDDHPDGLAVRKILLEALGYRVLAASTLGSGLRLFAKNHVDLVVFDYWITDLDGEVLAHVLRNLKPHVPIILLSGAIKNVPEQVLKLVDGVVQKGHSTEVLLSTVAELCGSSTSNSPGLDRTADEAPGSPTLTAA
jgi:CheY-like chemotaxis protein